MNANYTRVLNYSSGKWCNVAKMKTALGLTERNRVSHILTELGALNGVCCQIIHDAEGSAAWFRAYRTNKRNVIELAKFRKSLGLTCALESYRFGGVA